MTRKDKKDKKAVIATATTIKKEEKENVSSLSSSPIGTNKKRKEAAQRKLHEAIASPIKEQKIAKAADSFIKSNRAGWKPLTRRKKIQNISSGSGLSQRKLPYGVTAIGKKQKINEQDKKEAPWSKEASLINCELFLSLTNLYEKEHQKLLLSSRKEERINARKEPSVSKRKKSVSSINKSKYEFFIRNYLFFVDTIKEIEENRNVAYLREGYDWFPVRIPVPRDKIHLFGNRQIFLKDFAKYFLEVCEDYDPEYSIADSRAAVLSSYSSGRVPSFSSLSEEDKSFIKDLKLYIKHKVGKPFVNVGAIYNPNITTRSRKRFIRSKLEEPIGIFPLPASYEKLVKEYSSHVKSSGRRCKEQTKKEKEEKGKGCINVDCFVTYVNDLYKTKTPVARTARAGSNISSYSLSRSRNKGRPNGHDNMGTIDYYTSDPFISSRDNVEVELFDMLVKFFFDGSWEKAVKKEEEMVSRVLRKLTKNRLFTPGELIRIRHNRSNIAFRLSNRLYDEDSPSSWEKIRTKIDQIKDNDNNSPERETEKNNCLFEEYKNAMLNRSSSSSASASKFYWQSGAYKRPAGSIKRNMGGPIHTSTYGRNKYVRIRKAVDGSSISKYGSWEDIICEYLFGVPIVYIASPEDISFIKSGQGIITPLSPHPDNCKELGEEENGIVLEEIVIPRFDRINFGFGFIRLIKVLVGKEIWAVPLNPSFGIKEIKDYIRPIKNSGERASSLGIFSSCPTGNSNWVKLSTPLMPIKLIAMNLNKLYIDEVKTEQECE